VVPRWHYILSLALAPIAIGCGIWGLSTGNDSFATWVQFAVGVSALLTVARARKHGVEPGSFQGDT
jgi:hypothetical protein